MPNGLLSRDLLAKFDPVAVILSPPRCGSTVLARSFWQHRAFRWYLHEPYDRAYHLGEEPKPVADLLIERVNHFDRAEPASPCPAATGIVIKEMAFQAGEAISNFLETTMPVIFLIRDPRLSVFSRMRRRELDGDVPAFPAKDAGWQDLLAGISLFRETRTPYVIVDASDIRRNPGTALRSLCDRLGLPWDPAMLRWERRSGIRLGNIGGRQDAWYARVLSSTGWEQPDEKMPPPDAFREHGMGTVVMECLAAYRHVRTDPQYLQIGEPALASPEAWKT